MKDIRSINVYKQIKQLWARIEKERSNQKKKFPDLKRAAERERETERDKDRQTQTDRQMDRQTETERVFSN